MNPEDLCSRCHENFYRCRCDQFYPNMKSDFTLTPDEVIALLEYFYQRAGYLSQEFDPLVHKIISRLEKY